MHEIPNRTEMPSIIGMFIGYFIESGPKKKSTDSNVKVHI